MTDPVNIEAPNMEPKDYFEYLKDRVSEVTAKELEAAKQILYQNITRADSLGQTNLLHKSSFAWETLEKELALAALGYNKCVDLSDVNRFIDSVSPKNSVKIIELDKYPRIIPEGPADAIIKAKELGIFKNIVIVYTDFADEEVLTPQQKAVVARNKDPIAFGIFYDEPTGTRHERMYFITDWEDEFCDLTFPKMIAKMSEMGIKNPEKTVEISEAYINSVVAKSKEQIQKSTLNMSGETSISFVSKLLKKFKLK